MHQKVEIIHMEVWQMLPSVNKQDHSSKVLCYSILVWYDIYGYRLLWSLGIMCIDLLVGALFVSLIYTAKWKGIVSGHNQVIYNRVESEKRKHNVHKPSCRTESSLNFFKILTAPKVKREWRLQVCDEATKPRFFPLGVNVM